MKKAFLPALCCLFACTLPAKATPVTVDGMNYDITTVVTSVDDGLGILESQPWWADTSGVTALAFAQAYYSAGGTGRTFFGYDVFGAIHGPAGMIPGLNAAYSIPGYGAAYDPGESTLALDDRAEFGVATALPDAFSTGPLLTIALVGLAAACHCRRRPIAL